MGIPIYFGSASENGVGPLSILHLNDAQVIVICSALMCQVRGCIENRRIPGVHKYSLTIATIAIPAKAAMPAPQGARVSLRR